MHRYRRSRGALSAFAAALLAAGCASATSTRAPAGPADSPVARRGVPGFDTREFPGEAALAAWRRHSPYQWVGYYLESPCRPGSTWTGNRPLLDRQGWGVAVLYVGEQQWRDTTTATPAPGETLRCSRANLTAERGAADALDARRVAAAEGFSAGTHLFLNVERVDSIGEGLRAYVQAWTRGLLEEGTYRPALYAHALNVAALQVLMAAEFEARGGGGGPAVWVARGTGFDLAAAPSESGFAYASIWQGRFDVRETWGDVTLPVDANVADRASPSAP